MKIIKVENIQDCHSRNVNQECIRKFKPCYLDYELFPDWCPLTDPPDAHEIWAAAQLSPGEGIEDGVKRIEEILKGDEG